MDPSIISSRRMAAQPALLGHGAGVLAEGVAANGGGGERSAWVAANDGRGLGSAWVAAQPAPRNRRRPALSLRAIRRLPRPIHWVRLTDWSTHASSRGGGRDR